MGGTEEAINWVLYAVEGDKNEEGFSPIDPGKPQDTEEQSSKEGKDEARG